MKTTKQTLEFMLILKLRGDDPWCPQCRDVDSSLRISVKGDAAFFNCPSCNFNQSELVENFSPLVKKAMKKVKE